MYSRGVHLEDRLAASHFEKKSGPVAFPAPPNSSYNNKIQFLTDQVASLTTALHIGRAEDHRQGRGSIG
jgi:hypothetical protein